MAEPLGDGKKWLRPTAANADFLYRSRGGKQHRDLTALGSATPEEFCDDTIDLAQRVFGKEAKVAYDAFFQASAATLSHTLAEKKWLPPLHRARCRIG